MSDHDTKGLPPASGSAPTDAHLEMNALLARVLLEVARRRRDELPVLLESCQDRVLLTTGGTKRQVRGWFKEHAWRLRDGDRHVHEVFLNADLDADDPSIGDPEDVLVTLLHEGCHAYAQAKGIKDTSRDGRYHNRRFAEIALTIGLEIEKHTVFGHVTPGLSPQGRCEYADLLAELEQGLVLAREPRPIRPDRDKKDDSFGEPSETDKAPANTSKYVFASCGCQAGRGRRVTIRVARGSWRPGVIRCHACGGVFEESLPGSVKSNGPASQQGTAGRAQ